MLPSAGDYCLALFFHKVGSSVVVSLTKLFIFDVADSARVLCGVIELLALSEVDWHWLDLLTPSGLDCDWPVELGWYPNASSGIFYSTYFSFVVLRNFLFLLYNFPPISTMWDRGSDFWTHVPSSHLLFLLATVGFAQTIAPINNCSGRSSKPLSLYCLAFSQFCLIFSRITSSTVGLSYYRKS